MKKQKKLKKFQSSDDESSADEQIYDKKGTKYFWLSWLRILIHIL